MIKRLSYPIGLSAFRTLTFERPAGEIMEAAALQVPRVQAAIEKRSARIQELLRDESQSGDITLDAILTYAEQQPLGAGSPYDPVLTESARVVLFEAQQILLERELRDHFEFIAKHLSRDKTQMIRMLIDDACLIFDEYQHRDIVPPPAFFEELADQPIAMQRVPLGIPVPRDGWPRRQPMRIADLLRRRGS